MPPDFDVPPLSDRFTAAIVWAAKLHARQRRKGTEIPYVAHLLAVCALVLEDGGDEDQAIAALLHDAVEDQGGRPVLEEIGSRFGARVAAIVEACTDADTIPKPPWRERKERYVRHIGSASPEARRVSCADKVHNARAILGDYRAVREKLWRRFTGGRDGTLWYYRSLVAAFREAGSGPLVDELDRVVTELERLAGPA